jgi:bifunctional non-homologous end joining protein LigD
MVIQRPMIGCAPILRRAPPSGPDWIHEIKWDGWRLQAHKRTSGVTLYSRPGRDITKKFSYVAQAIAALPRRTVVLDGELLAFNEDGRPDFHLLRRKRVAVVAFLFDTMKCNGADLRGKPWRERRQYLKQVMGRNRSDDLRISEIWTDGLALLRAVGELGLEGFVSKHRDPPYRAGATDASIKTKVFGAGCRQPARVQVIEM